ncbi:MAG: AIR synthase related protein, partial [Candidatus Daviesbacteria bacterium]|nr:AIR synthase related protein [Candidatus Daviesbacteria bacterium]
MIQKVRVQTIGQSNVKVYRLEGISEKETKILAERLLSEKINQRYTINQPIHSKVVEIAYKPGVMNPEVASIMKASSDLGIKLITCDSSVEYLNKQVCDSLDLKKVSFNPLTEHIVTEEPKTLILKGKPGKTQVIPIRSLSDKELLDLSKDTLFLNLEELREIQKYFQKIKKDPTDLELETLAQTWSEHSGHKTFKADLIVDGRKKEPLMTRLKKEALKHDKNIVSAFVDNSGVMDFYEGFGICGKVETHNAPSAIEPYGGAMTGSGGVFRDIAATGMGAKNIASTDIFCFAPVDLPAEELPVGCLPPEYLLKRVVAGVRDYGNRMGIPTNNGSVHFHKDFRARPTVIVGAFGIVPKKYAIKEKPKIGDLIVSAGGRTGRDGIHGATFSSGEMTDRTIEVHSSAVQIGNAIEEKRMFDAL